jgi:hypothetical protein
MLLPCRLRLALGGASYTCLIYRSFRFDLKAVQYLIYNEMSTTLRNVCAEALCTAKMAGAALRACFALHVTQVQI